MNIEIEWNLFTYQFEDEKEGSSCCKIFKK